MEDQQLERAVILLNRYNQDEEIEQANQPESATRRWDRIWKLIRRHGAAIYGSANRGSNP